MASLLTKSSLALWVWIVIIVVGSLVVLSTVALVLRLILLRRRRTTFIETFGDENIPQRKLTLRRGRVVASSNHLSLTGSKFGFSAFNREADTSSKISTRSKSPFEWWNSVKDRSHSRSSQVTQTTQATYDRSSILGSYTSPKRNLIYQRSDAGYSNLSLASSRDDEISTTITESQPSPPPVAARKPPNFSRSFSHKYYGDDFPSRQHTLSRIEELSPHTSMISTRHARNASRASRASNARDTYTATPSPLPPSSSPSIPQGSILHQRGQSEQIFSRGMSSHDDVFAIPSGSLDLSDMRAQNNSTSSFNRAELARLSTISNYKNGPASDQDLSQQHSQITALPATSDTNNLSYWSTRTDLRPIRSNSKKGNVLRKKSLRRSEMIARFES